MTRTNTIRLRAVFGICAAWAVGGLLACTTPATAPEPLPTEPGNALEPTMSVVDGPTAVAKPTPGPAVSSTPNAAATESVAPLKKSTKTRKKSRRKSSSEGMVAEEEDTGTAKEIVIHCKVRLPDDNTDHPELCRNFRIVLLDESGTEVTRFLFDGQGVHRFTAEPGKTYKLKPLIADNWSFDITPQTFLRAGDRAQAVFTQRLGF
jgi:hypothetical protein